MIKKLFLAIFFAVGLFATESVTVATAANVQYAMDDLAAEFKKQSGIEVKPIFGATGKFAQQIKAGAPFDLLVAADTKFPQDLFKDGFAAGEPKIYAYGSLVVWTMRDDIDITKWQTLLTDKKVSKIAIANPKIAPYGAQSVNALNFYKLYDAVKDKFVMGESISQVNSFLVSGAVDIAFNAKSVASSKEMSGKGKWVEVDKKAYEKIAQAVVITKAGFEKNRVNSQKFFDFLLSPAAKKIFEQNGYTAP